MPPDDKKKSGLALMIAMKPKGDESPPEEEPAQTSEEEGQYITPPEGFRPPDDKRTGESFTGTYRAHMDENGKLCFEAINEIDLKPGDKEVIKEEASTEEPVDPSEDTGEGLNKILNRA